MRIEEYLESRSASEGTLLNEKEVSYLVEYVRQFSFIEILDFSAQISSLHDVIKSVLNEPEDGLPKVTSLLAFVRMIETIKDGREMLREVFKASEFTPPTKP